MSKKEKASGTAGIIIKGLLTDRGVKIPKNQNVEELSSKGYGVTEKDEFLLTFYEALYLFDKGLLEVKDEKGKKIEFQRLLQQYEKIEENAWVRYLTYRDLRSRGYVVREGFGLGVDFRVYERGDYGKDTAKYLVLSVQEGKPIALEDLTRIMTQSQSLKKELILTVMNRRGEIVYYSVSQLTLK
ncbi:tRNA-intron lyase [Candidatus Bathyarchaeota archaeon]|nr:tRNA-intron lyase [Candidatus Bathyarchaeota archaeon]